MKKILSIALAALLSATLAISCVGCNIDTGTPNTPGGNQGNTPGGQTPGGSTSGGENPGGETPGGNQEDPPVTNPDAVTVTVATLGKQDEIALMRRWTNAYNKAHPEVNIQIVKQMQGMPDTTLWMSSNEMPDIIWTAGDQHSPYSGYYKYFQDLSDESKFEGSKEFFADFYDSLIDTTHATTEDTGIWFVPRDYNRLVVYLNKTAFEAAGIPLPENDWTFEEFIGICNALMDKGAKKGVEWMVWRPIFTTMLQNFGGKYVENGKLALESKETEACVDFFRKIYERGRSESDPYLGIAMKTTTAGEFFTNYPDDITDSIPMTINVRPQLPSFISMADAGGWELEVRAFPNFKQADGSDGYVGAGCSGYGITTACTDPAKISWAWKFLKWCMSEEGYNEVADLGNIVPALKSMRSKGAWRDYEYYGASVDADAFVYENTRDIFLNYQNGLPVSKHDDFIARIDDFWTNILTGGYRGAIDRLKEDCKALGID